MLIKLVRGDFSAKFLLIEFVTSEPFLGLFFHVRGDILWNKINSLLSLTSMGCTTSFTPVDTFSDWQGFGDAVVDDVV